MIDAHVSPMSPSARHRRRPARNRRRRWCVRRSDPPDRSGCRRCLRSRGMLSSMGPAVTGTRASRPARARARRQALRRRREMPWRRRTGRARARTLREAVVLGIDDEIDVALPCRVTFFERWRATAGRPMLSNSGAAIPDRARRIRRIRSRRCASDWRWSCITGIPDAGTHIIRSRRRCRPSSRCDIVLGVLYMENAGAQQAAARPGPKARPPAPHRNFRPKRRSPRAERGRGLLPPWFLSSVMDTVGARSRREKSGPHTRTPASGAPVVIETGELMLVGGNARHGIDDAFAQGGAAAPTGQVFHGRARAVDGRVIERAGFDAIGRVRVLHHAQPIGRQSALSAPGREYSTPTCGP
jgi:hypothetical protein